MKIKLTEREREWGRERGVKKERACFKLCKRNGDGNGYWHWCNDMTQLVNVNAILFHFYLLLV